MSQKKTLSLFKKNWLTIVSIAALSIAPLRLSETTPLKELNPDKDPHEITLTPEQKREEREKFEIDSIHFNQYILPKINRSWRHTFNRDQHASLVFDENGKELWAKNADDQRRPASISKLMTLYLVLEGIQNKTLNWDDPIYISPNAYYKQLSFKEFRSSRPQKNKAYPLEELVKAMMTVSDNTSATALAEHLACTEENFGHLMTAKAESLGMCNTHFTNPSGLPYHNSGKPSEKDNLSTARDIGILINKTYQDFPNAHEYMHLKKYKWFNSTAWRHEYDGFLIAKTGTTNASGTNIAMMIEKKCPEHLDEPAHQYTIIFMGAYKGSHRDTIVRLFKNGLSGTTCSGMPKKSSTQQLSL